MGTSSMNGILLVEKSSIKSFWLLNMAMDNGTCVDNFLMMYLLKMGLVLEPAEHMI